MRTAHSRVCVCVLKSSHAEKPTVHHNPTHAALQERLDLQPCATPRHVALCRRHASPSNSAMKRRGVCFPPATSGAACYHTHSTLVLGLGISSSILLLEA